MDGAAPKKSLQSLLNGFISKKAKAAPAPLVPAGPPANALKRRRSSNEEPPRAMAPSRNLHVSNLSPATTER